MMRNLILFFALAAVAFISCNNTEKEDLSKEFDELMAESDSLEQVHNEFQTIHQQMSQTHEELRQQLQNAQVQDSTILEDLAEHGAF